MKGRSLVSVPKRRCCHCNSTEITFYRPTHSFADAYFCCNKCKSRNTYFKETEKAKHFYY